MPLEDFIGLELGHVEFELDVLVPQPTRGDVRARLLLCRGEAELMRAQLFNGILDALAQPGFKHPGDDMQPMRYKIPGKTKQSRHKAQLAYQVRKRLARRLSHAERAQRWVLSTRASWLYDFEVICSHLGYESDVLRYWIAGTALALWIAGSRVSTRRDRIGRTQVKPHRENVRRVA